MKPQFAAQFSNDGALKPKNSFDVKYAILVVFLYSVLACRCLVKFASSLLTS